MAAGQPLPSRGQLQGSPIESIRRGFASPSQDAQRGDWVQRLKAGQRRPALIVDAWSVVRQARQPAQHWCQGSKSIASVFP